MTSYPTLHPVRNAVTSWRVLPWPAMVSGVKLLMVRAAVQAVLEQWCVVLGELVRTPVDATLDEFNMGHVNDWTREESQRIDDVVLCCALSDNLYFDFEYDWVSKVVESFCGGSAPFISQSRARRPLSKAEQKMRERLLGQLIQSLNAVWEKWLPEDLVPISVASCPSCPIRFMRSSFKVLDVPFQLRWGSQTVHGHWHLPLTFLQRVPAWQDRQSPSANAMQDDHHHTWSELPIDVRVVMGEFGLSVQDLHSLSLGQFIPFEPSTQVQMLLNDVPVARGELYTSKGRNVVQLSQAVEGLNPPSAVVTPQAEPSAPLKNKALQY